MKNFFHLIWQTLCHFSSSLHTHHADKHKMTDKFISKYLNNYIT